MSSSGCSRVDGQLPSGRILSPLNFRPQTLYDCYSYKVYSFPHQTVIRHLISLHIVKMNESHQLTCPRDMASRTRQVEFLGGILSQNRRNYWPQAATHMVLKQRRTTKLNEVLLCLRQTVKRPPIGNRWAFPGRPPHLSQPHLLAQVLKLI